MNMFPEMTNSTYSNPKLQDPLEEWGYYSES